MMMKLKKQQQQQVNENVMNVMNVRRLMLLMMKMKMHRKNGEVMKEEWRDCVVELGGGGKIASLIAVEFAVGGVSRGRRRVELQDLYRGRDPTE